LKTQFWKSNYEDQILKKPIFEEIFGLNKTEVNAELPCAIINKKFGSKVEWYVDTASTENTDLAA